MATAEVTYTTVISTFLARFSEDNPTSQTAVILIGSVARNAATAQSDIDLLIIGDNLHIPRSADRLHVQVFGESEFLSRLASGDDFVGWCVRFGIPLVDSGTWNRIVTSPEAGTWPDWRQKTVHAARRLLLANDLYNSGDMEAASEELLYAVSHVGRAILLSKNVFPLSRPEMIRQLGEAGHSRLSSILNELSFTGLTPAGIKRAIFYLKKLLVYLDAVGFQKHGASRVDARRRKLIRPLSKKGISTVSDLGA